MTAVDPVRQKRGKRVDGSLFFFILLSGAICFESYNLGLGTLSNPAPGLFPFLTGAILGFLSILWLVINLLPGGPWGWLNISISWGRVVPMLGGLFLYSIILDFLGFALATFLLVLALLKGIERKSWVSSSMVAIGISIFSYIVFRIWLRVQLPEGFLGI
ncbi:MAG: tripartite tricarboxylate transporter TctB family protein [Deltaproteobacteria bacterium]|jgi:putative tricarboxylic transport membrane protein|nr:tripartite tricarboxylate transporter TctB family protein [Deltaproteobacteria bacterium]